MVAEHTVLTPKWISALVEDVVVECVTPQGFMGQLGYRYWPPDDAGLPWTVAAYPTPTAVVGDAVPPGAVTVSGFRFDVGRLLAAMSGVTEVVWAAPAKYNGNMDGPEISVRGVFAGKHVWFRFFHLPPPDESPAYSLDLRTAEATELSA